VGPFLSPFPRASPASPYFRVFFLQRRFPERIVERDSRNPPTLPPSQREKQTKLGTNGTGRIAFAIAAPLPPPSLPPALSLLLCGGFVFRGDERKAPRPRGGEPRGGNFFTNVRLSGLSAVCEILSRESRELGARSGRSHKATFDIGNTRVREYAIRSTRAH